MYYTVILCHKLVFFVLMQLKFFTELQPYFTPCYQTAEKSVTHLPTPPISCIWRDQIYNHYWQMHSLFSLYPLVT